MRDVTEHNNFLWWWKVMGTVGETDAIVTLVHKAASFAQLGTGWYREGREFDEFRSKVDTITVKQDLWTTQLRRYGMLTESVIGPMLYEAFSLLEEEEARFEQMQAKCSIGCWRRTSLTVFPPELTASMQRVIDSFNNISQHSTSRWLRTFTLPFRTDKRYVLLKKTISDIKRSLENKDGPRVVVLHGAPGSGKSYLARHLGLNYQQEQAEQSPPNIFPDGVFYLACGEGADIVAKQLELLQELGFPVLPGPDEDFKQQDHPTTALNKRLMMHLNEQNVLLILDDVGDSELLRQLLVPGKRVKYLVTSQHNRLWEDSKRIKLQTVGLEDARRLLATHLGLTDGILPSHVQDVADAMILGTGSLPLALANLSIAINSRRLSDSDEWLSVKKNFMNLLEAEHRNTVTFGQEFPRSVASTMSLAVDSLPPSAQKLLYAIAVFQGPSVPEVVVKMLVKSTQGDVASFYRWRNYLEDRALIQIQFRTVAWSKYPLTTLSIHVLRQVFIRVRKSEEVNFMMMALINRQREAEVDFNSDLSLATALCVVYGDRNFALKAAQKLGFATRATQYDMIKAKIFRTRSWASPVLSLLDVAGEEDWRQQTHFYARQVIVGHLCKGNVESSVMNLLAMREAAVATCWALSIPYGLCEKLKISKCDDFLPKLVDLMGNNANLETQEKAVMALAGLATGGGENGTKILSFPGALERVVELLAMNVNPGVKACALTALRKLAGTGKANPRSSLLTIPRRSAEITGFAVQGWQLGCTEVGGSVPGAKEANGIKGTARLQEKRSFPRPRMLASPAVVNPGLQPMRSSNAVKASQQIEPSWNNTKGSSLYSNIPWR